MVVSRAIIRDMFPPEDAQRVMSQVTIYFGVAPGRRARRRRPAVRAPGLALDLRLPHLRRRRAVAAHLAHAAETLHTSQVQSFHPVHLLRGYWQLVSSPRFLALALASGVPFNGMFLYVLAAPVFLGELLHLQPTQFFWLFALTISGIMGGAWLSGRLAGRHPAGAADRARLRDHVHDRAVQRRVGAVLPARGAVGAAADRHLLVRLGADGAGRHAAGARPGAATARHGSSLQACIGSGANAFVAGVIVPLVMHSTSRWRSRRC
jgi:DHA1 family bicyclomycin/chloramphenicol resistance-like MFS transporter